MNDSSISVAEITRAEVQYHSQVRHTRRHARSRFVACAHSAFIVDCSDGADTGKKRGSPGLGRNEAVRDEMGGDRGGLALFFEGWMFGVPSCAVVDLVRSWVMVDHDYSLVMLSSKVIDI